MFDNYNDTYKTPTEEIMGKTFYALETDYHILKNRREELGLTQQQVADIAKIQLRQYQRLESGERSMYGASFRIAMSVCDALKLDPYRFFPMLKR